MPANVLEGVLKRDRLVVLASLVMLTAIAWLYLFQMAGDIAAMDATPAPSSGMESMPGMEDRPGIDMPGMKMDRPAGADTAGASSFTTFLFLAAMWMVMMVGMMLPSASSTILLFAAL